MTRVFLRPIVATVVLVLVVVSFQAWSWQSGRHRLEGFPVPRHGATVDIEITLPFTPEAFNIERLQEAGRLVRIAGRHVFLKSVDRNQLTELARLYWIGRISLWRAS
jgi:hypothetical protein